MMLQAAIDQHKSDLSGQEVTFAKAIAAEIKQREVDGVAAQDGLTREDIEQDLRLAAERKQAIDDDKARNAGADYKHVGRILCLKVLADALLNIFTLTG